MSTHRFRWPLIATETAFTLALTACAGAQAGPSPTTDAEPVAGGEVTLEFWPENAAFACVDPFQNY